MAGYDFVKTSSQYLHKDGITSFTNAYKQAAHTFMAVYRPDDNGTTDTTGICATSSTFAGDGHSLEYIVRMDLDAGMFVHRRAGSAWAELARTDGYDQADPQKWTWAVLSKGNFTASSVDRIAAIVANTGGAENKLGSTTSTGIAQQLTDTIDNTRFGRRRNTDPYYDGKIFSIFFIGTDLVAAKVYSLGRRVDPLMVANPNQIRYFNEWYRGQASTGTLTDRYWKQSLTSVNGPSLATTSIPIMSRGAVFNA